MQYLYKISSTVFMEFFKDCSQDKPTSVHTKLDVNMITKTNFSMTYNIYVGF